MTGSGKLAAADASLVNSSSPANYTIPPGFTPPLATNAGGTTAPYTVTCGTLQLRQRAEPHEPRQGRRQDDAGQLRRAAELRPLRLQAPAGSEGLHHVGLPHEPSGRLHVHERRLVEHGGQPLLRLRDGEHRRQRRLRRPGRPLRRRARHLGLHERRRHQRRVVDQRRALQRQDRHPAGVRRLRHRVAADAVPAQQDAGRLQRRQDQDQLQRRPAVQGAQADRPRPTPATCRTRPR